MNSVGSLFSGCGGADLGFELAGFETKWFSETDKWCSEILEKNFPNIPNLGDVNELEPDKVDILVGGFPCQPVSQAGKKKGEKDDRWLWPAFYRTILLLRPKIVVVENVPGLRKRGFDKVLGDLAKGGYNAQWFSLRSSDIGAPHRRERVFIITDSAGTGPQGKQPEEGQELFAGSLTTDGYGVRFKGEWQQNVKWKNKDGDDSDRFASEEQDWGKYKEAIRRWESIFELAPPPLTYSERLSPKFVEWMMGFPQNWTEGVSRSQRIKMLGNSVQVQSAYYVAQFVKGTLNDN